MRPRPSRAFHPIENDSAGLEEEGEFCSLGSDRATSSHSSWHSRTMINSPWVWLLTGRSTALENRRPSNSSGSSGSIGKFLNSTSGGGGSTSSSHSAGSRLVITNGLRLAVVLILCSCFVPLYLLLQVSSLSSLGIWYYTFLLIVPLRACLVELSMYCNARPPSNSTLFSPSPCEVEPGQRRMEAKEKRC